MTHFRRKERHGFTLAEVLIASSIFTLVSIIGVIVFVDVMRIQRRIVLENGLHEDARLMMEYIAREVRQNMIDYEEYYRADRGGLEHGEQFGCYAQRFYNPGVPAAIGAECSFPIAGLPVEDDPTCIVNKNSLDVNSGQNPYADPGRNATDANAFCDEINNGDANCAVGSSDYSIEQDQLYLISADGKEKTFMGRKYIAGSSSEYAVGILKLHGMDNDSDGIAEVWRDGTNYYQDICAPGFDCPASIDSLDDNLSGVDDEPLLSGFVPVTPLRTDVTRLSFYVSPVEDPRKAFSETDPAEQIQQQPHVTVVMTVQPALSQLSGYAGEPPSLTLQTTVSSRVLNEVPSYIGVPIAGCPAL